MPQCHGVAGRRVTYKQLTGKEGICAPSVSDVASADDDIEAVMSKKLDSPRKAPRPPGRVPKEFQQFEDFVKRVVSVPKKRN